MIAPFAPPSALGLAAAVLISALIAGAAVPSKALTRSGAIAAFFVGVACLGFGGFAVGAPLLIFFVSGTLLGRVRSQAVREPLDDVQHKRAARDAVQVAANGGGAAACALFAGLLTHGAPHLALALEAGSIGALAVAAADTWATEIGAFSPTPPRSIVSGRVVVAGASGGVTPLGWLGSVAGALAIAAAGAAFAPQLRGAAWIAGVSAAGVIGAAIDSFLGAAAQGAWYCDRCAVPCEVPVHRCGEAARLVSGLPWLDNDGVNAIATVAGAALGFGAFALTT